MILYQFFDGNATRVFGTQAEAIKEAKAEQIEQPDFSITVDKVETGPLTKELLIDIINSCGGSYIKSSKTIWPKN